MNPILYIGISQFLFAALLIFTKPRRHLGDTTLGLWLLLMCIFMGLTLAKSINPDSFWSRLQLFPFFFTIGPFLLFYVRFLTGKKKQFAFGDGLHILPFAVFSAVAVTQSHTVDEDIVHGRLLKSEMLIYIITALTSFAYYMVTTLTELRRHSLNIQDFFSYDSGKINLRWVRLVIITFSLTLILTLLNVGLNTLNEAQTINPGIPLFLGLTIFGYGVSFFGIRQPQIFADKPTIQDERFVDTLEEETKEETPVSSEPIPEPEAVSVTPSTPPQPVQVADSSVQEDAATPDLESSTDTESSTSSEAEKSKKYSRSGLRPNQAEAYLIKLQDYLEAESPYLRRDLTIQDIAQALDIPQHHLTQTINELLNKNFYTLINEYRVEEVKKRLLNPKFNHLTVLAIAHDAGFNSKSSFNMTFKKYVGMTPSQYKRKNGN